MCAMAKAASVEELTSNNVRNTSEHGHPVNECDMTNKANEEWIVCTIGTQDNAVDQHDGEVDPSPVEVHRPQNSLHDTAIEKPHNGDEISCIEGVAEPAVLWLF